MSTSSTSPAILFGGSWTKIEGRFLWATGSTPMTTGGSRTTDSTVLTINQIPSHNHGFWNQNSGGYEISGSYTITIAGNKGFKNFYTDSIGGGKGHTHTYMPPYFEVYMWYRTA